MGSGWARRQALAACMATGMALAGCGGGASEGPGAGGGASGPLAGNPSATAPGAGSTGTTTGSTQDGTGAVTSTSPASGVAAGSFAGQGTIGTQGGSIELPGVGAIRLPPATLPTAAAVQLTRTMDPHVSSNFEETAVMFGASVKAPYEMHVLLGREQPTGDVEVRLQVPPELRAKAGTRDEVRLFYLNVYDDGSERLETAELTDPRGLPSDASVTALVPMEAFQARADGRFEGWFYLGLTPSAPIGGPAAKQPRAGVAPGGEVVDSHPARPDVAGKIDQSRACAGAMLALPVDASFRISSPYGPRRAPVAGASRWHRGIDFGVPLGTPVRAAADGKVEIRRQVDERSGEMIGWGRYVVLHHAGLGRTLYGHLKDDGIQVRNGKIVAAGEVIALSGQTGTGDGPHLHFEYAPIGDIFKRDNKVDPEPCLAQVPGGNLMVRDNGSLFDDAFTVAMNDRQVCRTRVGEANACSLGDLRPGTYRLAITVVTASDGQGTFEIRSQDPKVRIAGQTLLAGSAALGETREYELTVDR